MKKKAILIASIMFAAGCATNRARYSSNESANPALSAQYDPATGGYPSTSSGSSYRHLNNTSVNDFHADSSIRGGSNEARGWAQRDFLPPESAPRPMNPAVQADSSIRGGSNEGRSGSSFHSSNDQFLQNPDEDMIDKSTSFDYYVLVPTEPSVASDDRSNLHQTGIQVMISCRMEFKLNHRI